MKKRHKILFDTHKVDVENDRFGHGIAIWVNNTWVLDASCFTKDMMITIDTKRLKLVMTDKINKKMVFKYDKRFK